MKTSKSPWILLLLIIIAFSSCRSSKELIYQKDILTNQMIESLADTVTEYIVKPGDILYVSIKSISTEVNALFNPESNMEQSSYNSYQKFSTQQGAYLYGYEIGADGAINLPILGKVYVAGYPQSEVEAIVQQQADEYLKEGIVKVKLLNYKVTVLGEVNNPGVYYNYSNNFTILEALAMASGNTNYATITDVVVIRPQPEGEKAMVLDLSSSEAWLQEGFYLHPNDYIVVKPDKSKNLQLNSQAYSMVVSSLSLLVALLGLMY